MEKGPSVQHRLGQGLGWGRNGGLEEGDKGEILN